MLQPYVVFIKAGRKKENNYTFTLRFGIPVLGIRLERFELKYIVVSDRKALYIFDLVCYSTLHRTSLALFLFHCDSI